MGCILLQNNAVVLTKLDCFCLKLLLTRDKRQIQLADRFVHQQGVVLYSIFYFYIKSQLRRFFVGADKGCTLFCFYIKSQHTGGFVRLRAVVPYSASTSNHNFLPGLWHPLCCTLFCFYIKSQLLCRKGAEDPGCTLFCFYIKSQHVIIQFLFVQVVSYSDSTSNHNTWRNAASC